MAKTVGIGVTGGIAVYKVAELVSRLKKEDFEVIVMMTEAATRFVTPLTFQTLSGREVVTDLWDRSQEWKVKHIGVAETLDLLVIAPATADFIAKMARGMGDDLLSTVVLANTAPVLVVPAMNSNMYLNPAVQDNISILKGYGYRVMEPDSGPLACGTSGPGRMPEVDVILEQISAIFRPSLDLKGKRLLVNAGSTCENIDPVRFISNRGTGKMGFAIAEEAAERGAEVILVCGNSPLNPPSNVELISVWNAEEMYQVMINRQTECDVIIGAAAVSDFRVAGIAEQKLKKSGDPSEELVLRLVGCPDILKEIGKNKQSGQITVGFAAETEDIIANAKKKLETKNLDFIVANDVTQEGAGFATDTNIVTFIHRNGQVKSLPIMAKREVAAAILDQVVELF